MLEATEDDVVYLYLPLAHLLSRIVQIMTFEHSAALAYFGGDIRAVVTELAEVAPTHLPSVPRLFEKVYAQVAALAPDPQRLRAAVELGLSVRRGEPVTEDERARPDQGGHGRPATSTTPPRPPRRSRTAGCTPAISPPPTSRTSCAGAGGSRTRCCTATASGGADHPGRRGDPAQIRGFALLDHDFTVEDGQLTPSLKVKRPVVNARYRDILDGLYT